MKAKMMDLQYFLEMVDLKHRYGSNLRVYHSVWHQAPTRENFFYWLDYGEGKDLDLQICSRKRLDRERVRYLSREERMDYLVRVDKEGRLCWRRNGVRIDTTEEWKDSLKGIVPKGDVTPAFGAAEMTEKKEGTAASSEDELHEESGLQSDAAPEDEGVKRYSEGLESKKGHKKVIHVSPAAILDRLLRKSVRKNTWIFVSSYTSNSFQTNRLHEILSIETPFISFFHLNLCSYLNPKALTPCSSLSVLTIPKPQVADTSMNLYVGIKQSGSFQHSSFLRGARIAAAGLIKIRDGQLRSLSPLRYV